MLEYIVPAAMHAAPMLLQAEGQRQTNAANRDIASDTNASNAREAAENRSFQNNQAEREMRFQTDMSNTAHQREVSDLKAAGLNPILSVNAGSSTPTGASAGGSQAQMTTGAPQQNTLAGMSSFFSSAMETASTLNSMKKTDADTRLSNEQAALVKAQTAKTGVDAEVARKGIPESEFKNEAYDLIRPIIKKIKSGLRTNSQPDGADNGRGVKSYNPATKKFELTPKPAPFHFSPMR